jgi:hypothetical protein
VSISAIGVRRLREGAQEAASGTIHQEVLAMRYLCIHRGDETRPATPQLVENMGRLISEMTHAGVLVATEGCQPSVKGMRVRRTNGTVTVTDGPFTETKEIIGGFALIDVASKAEALEWTRRFLDVVGDGETEVRLIHGEPS